jgi:hypothetical protein
MLLALLLRRSLSGSSCAAQRDRSTDAAPRPAADEAWGLVASMKSAMTSASIGFVLARLPNALAKASSSAGLTTRPAGRPPPASRRPLFRSQQSLRGRRPRPRSPSRSFSWANPASLLATTNCSLDERTVTSNLSLATSIPTMTACTRMRSDGRRLALWPKRLFGFDGTADEDPCSSTGLAFLRALGPSSTTPTAVLSPHGRNQVTRAMRLMCEGDQKIGPDPVGYYVLSLAARRHRP